MTQSEQERLAILETQMAAMAAKYDAQAARNDATLAKMMLTLETQSSDLRAIKESFAQGRGFRLGMFAALPIGGGGIGAAIVKWLSSGGPH